LFEAHVLTKHKTACCILIVEDDRVARNALVHLLTHLGYRTVEATTVAEGLAVLNGQQFAIVDLNLPDGAGTAILKRIRAENRPMRVAVASGTSDENLWAEAQSYKPDLLLRKPIDMNQLLAWLEAAG
jgi:CheY-like chemotaxis protein